MRATSRCNRLRKPAASADYAAPDVEASLNGNSVSLEGEMMKMADTQAYYQAATNIYSKAIDMMRMAIGHTS